MICVFQSSRSGMDGLYIRNAQPKHQGIYTCEAKTPLDTISAQAYLQVVGKEWFQQSFVYIFSSPKGKLNLIVTVLIFQMSFNQT